MGDLVVLKPRRLGVMMLCEKRTISGEAVEGLVHMSVPAATFALTPEEAEVWADNFRELARAARDQREGKL